MTSPCCGLLPSSATGTSECGHPSPVQFGVGMVQAAVDRPTTVSLPQHTGMVRVVQKTQFAGHPRDVLISAKGRPESVAR